MIVLALPIAGLLAVPAQESASGGVSEFSGDGCLGTSYYLRLDLVDEAAVTAERAILGEVERLRRLLDRYDEASEFSSLVPGEPTRTSTELFDVLVACAEWRERTGGAFDAAVGHLETLWRAAEVAGAPPTDEEIGARLAEVAEGRWAVDDGVVTASPIALSLDALAKGYILDRAARAAVNAGATSVVVDIGGDITARGEAVEVMIANPGESADNGAPLAQIRLKDQTVATSGNYLRGFQVAGERVGHVLDPRTGKAVDGVQQASVVATCGATADALATSLLVLGPDEGIALVKGVEGAECLLVLAGGSLRATAGWPETDPSRLAALSPREEGWPVEKQVRVDLLLEKPKAGGRGRGRRRKSGSYRRPYVAVWVEDEAGEPVRTLCLWIQRERWLRDLRRWHRLHKDDRGLIDAVTRPTRNPGQYQLVWDGLDDAGKCLPLGKYQLVVEAAREHGTYQIARTDIDMTQERTRIELEPNVEVAGCTVSFGPPAASKPVGDAGDAR